MNLDTLAPNSNLKQHAEALRKVAADLAGDLKLEANSRYSDAKSQATSKFNDVRDQASDYLDTAKDFASDRPLVTFTLGVAAGFVLANLIRRAL